MTVGYSPYIIILITLDVIYNYDEEILLILLHMHND